MAIKVGRGLFRLWLVISVSWVVMVGALTWTSLPPDDWVNGGKMMIGRELTDEEVSRSTSGMFVDLVVRAKIERGVKMAVIPPIILLACGSAFVWAFKGFR